MASSESSDVPFLTVGARADRRIRPGNGLILDVGGEGRHPEAWNVNVSRVKTVGPQRGEPIPRLIVARADTLPFAGGVASSVILERTPLRRRVIEELLRVVQPAGTIILRHVPFPDADRHALAAELIPGRRQQSQILIGRQLVQETRFELSDH